MRILSGRLSWSVGEVCGFLGDLIMDGDAIERLVAACRGASLDGDRERIGRFSGNSDGASAAARTFERARRGVTAVHKRFGPGHTRVAGVARRSGASGTAIVL